MRITSASSRGTTTRAAPAIPTACIATTTSDVVHYFLSPNPGSAPVRGGEHLGRYWRKVHADDRRRSGSSTTAIVQGDEAVIEWSMFWTPQGHDGRVVTRGAEWFTFRDGRIAEIRSYYRQEPFDTELEGFAYDDRGYSTHEAVRSRPPLRRRSARWRSLELALVLAAIAPCAALLMWTYRQAERRDERDE